MTPPLKRVIEFEGWFECRHLAAEGVGPFLHALHAGDEAVVSALADWFLERGDPRGERIVEFIHDRTPAAVWQIFGLLREHAAYLHAFAKTRRMRRNPEKALLLPDSRREAAGLPIGPEAGYFVGGLGDFGQDDDASILDHNEPPSGQPGLWCQWVPNADGTAILWNGVEKFYDYVPWLEYLIAHFLAPWGYVLNGQVDWQGEEETDRGIIAVKDNRVEAYDVLT